ncbi:hypothetical protein P154DRAFT_564982 [Amniculicola lignicola CBS 123094]|uniref:Nucleolar protein Dnt1-like N-terminal domain-containing protein n=1 Tax=Amniculicola lignicola CBS 123094 TaxID=1392246 RepID=A0A6A5W8D4_9PLEO|nr:hypothetical protein P154DRAFT_564982 [Amniculicola lignicola CBS 123094]
MAAAPARMRLTVEVLPLRPENWRGPGRAPSYMFKGRKFALPVPLEHTFEGVWSQVEERYKRNYLTPDEAASFTIKKLQDAYDCDLDLGDTVSSIFEGETDPQKRMIKVVPSFVNRDFSVPFESNLRPAHAQENAQKRLLEINEQWANKRRRIELEQERDSVLGSQPYNRPVPSTEAGHSDSNLAAHADNHASRTNGDGRRSRSRSSVLYVNDTQTGQDEFQTIKEESPELGAPSMRTIPESEPETSPSPRRRFKKPAFPTSTVQFERQLARKRPSTSPQAHIETEQSSNARKTQQAEVEPDTAENGVEDLVMEHTTMGDTEDINGHSPVVSPKAASEAIPDHETSPMLRHKPLRHAYEPTPMNDGIINSSDPFLRSTRASKTYSRPLRTPKAEQNASHNGNTTKTSLKSKQGDESVSVGSHQSRASRARSFRLSEPDEILSTPEEEDVPRGGSPMHSVELLDRVRKSRLNRAGQGNQEPSVPSQEPLTSTPSTHTDTPQSTKPGALKKPSKSIFSLAGPRARNKISPIKVSNGASQGVMSASSTRKKGISPEQASRIDMLKKKLAEYDTTSSRSVQMPTQSEEPNQTVSTKSPNIVDTLRVPRIEHPPTRPTENENSASPNGSKEEVSLEKPQARQLEVAASLEITAGIDANRSIRRSTPRRTRVPLPQSTIASNSSTLSHSKSSKGSAAPKQVPKPVTSIEMDTIDPPQLPTTTSATRKEPRKSAIPLPDNVKHRVQGQMQCGSRSLSNDSTGLRGTPKQGIVSSSNGAKESTSQEGTTQGVSNTSIASRNTPVPLPKNVRGSTANGSSQLLVKEATPKTMTLEKEELKPGPRRTTFQGKAEVVQVVPTSTEPIVVSSNVSSTSYSSDGSDEDTHEKTLSIKSELPKTSQNFATSKQANLAKDKKKSLDDNEEEDVVDAEGSVSESQEPLSSDRRAEPGKIDRNKPTSKGVPWVAESWDFNGVNEQGRAQEPKAPQERGKAGTGSSDSGSKSEADDRVDAGSKSRSNSVAISNRSSPAVSHRAAVYLSHSPISEKSESEEDDEPASPTPLPAGTSVGKTTSDEDEEDDTSSSSESGTETQDEDVDEDEDAEMQDADAATLPPSSSPSVPSTAPHLSTPNMPPPSTGPTPRTSSKATLPSKPSSSQPTPAARPTYAKYPSLKQQLTSARTAAPISSKGKPIDPRVASLRKLKKGGLLDESGTDSEESSSDSSSSSGEDEVAPKRKRGGKRTKA